MTGSVTDERIEDLKQRLISAKASKMAEQAYMSKRQADLYALQSKLQKAHERLCDITEKAKKDMDYVLLESARDIQSFLPLPVNKNQAKKREIRGKSAIFRDWIRNYKGDMLKTADVPLGVNPGAVLSSIMKKEGWIKVGWSSYTRRKK